MASFPFHPRPVPARDQSLVSPELSHYLGSVHRFTLLVLLIFAAQLIMFVVQMLVLAEWTIGGPLH